MRFRAAVTPGFGGVLPLSLIIWQNSHNAGTDAIDKGHHQLGERVHSWLKDTETSPDELVAAFSADGRAVGMA